MIFLLNQFGGEIDFTYSNKANKSMMVFSVSKYMLAESVRSFDPVHACACMIRKSLDDYAFGLEDVL